MFDDEVNDRQSLRALVELKAQHPHLKVLLAVGGWTYSNEPTAEEPKNKDHFNNLASDANVENFVKSAIALVEEFKLDGIDVDWEYPEAAEAAKFVDILARMKKVRKPESSLSDGVLIGFDRPPPTSCWQ